MHDVLKQIWYEGLSPREKCKHTVEDALHSSEILKEKRKDFYETLTSEQRVMFDAYEDYLALQNRTMHEAAFEEGFRLGAILTRETLE